MVSPRELQLLYQQGQNISETLRGAHGVSDNTTGIIEISYDLQTGSYIRAMSDPEVSAHKKTYSAEIARTIRALCNPSSILEAGVGEATTLSGVVSELELGVKSYGFDLSWSRVAFARKWLASNENRSTTLCTGDLLHIPFASDSIDVVYTSHSIEPNRGSEKRILEELYRVARRYVILLEPAYELASNAARERMDRHGYCKELEKHALELGFRVVEHALFPLTLNPLNPTALTVIEKVNPAVCPPFALACPRYKNQLLPIDGMLFSEEALTVYPVVGGIPCLRIENGIFASKYKEVIPS